MAPFPRSGLGGSDEPNGERGSKAFDSTNPGSVRVLTTRRPPCLFAVPGVAAHTSASTFARFCASDMVASAGDDPSWACGPTQPATPACRA